MATVKTFIRVSRESIDKANIRFRLTDGRAMIDSSVRVSFNRKVSDQKDLLLRVYNDADKRGIDINKFNILADRRMRPENYVDKNALKTFSSHA
jgi:hypothetical protein